MDHVDDLFAQPDAAHMPAAYWFWHYLPSTSEIADQIAEMDAGGIKSFQIQARLAYPMGDYLNGEYLNACLLAVEEASRRHMTVGLYDEYNWQSGHAGGRTVAGADHLREQHVFWTRADFIPGGGSPLRCQVAQISSSTESLGPPAMQWHYEGGQVRWDDWALVAAVAAPAGDVTSVDQLLDLTTAAQIVESGPSGCTVSVQPPCGPAGQIVVFVSARCSTSRIPNYLLKESARRFVEVGCEPFASALGSHFGTTVKYLFFDQPHANIYSWGQHFGNLRNSLPYSEELKASLESCGVATLPQLLWALVEDVGERTAELRACFYSCYSQFACKTYLGTLAGWAASRGIALSGHEVLGHVGSWSPAKAFSNWDLRVNFGLDYFGIDSYRGITGVDAQDCVPQLSPKFGDSVARSNGRSGCIVEQYIAGRTAGAGAYAGNWGLTLEELRAQALRLHILGARQFLYHGFYQSDGNDKDFTRLRNPRFDFPPGLNFEPWWPYYRPFADEAGRLSVFLDGAQPVCEVALFYPLRTAWVEGSGHSFANHLAFWAEYLAERGVGFHLVDERDLLSGKVVGGALVVGTRRYRCLVLPCVTTLLSEDSLGALERLAASGALVVSSGETPKHLQNGRPGAEAAWTRIASRGNVHQFPSLPNRDMADGLLLGLVSERPYAQADSEGSPIWQWCGQDEEAWRVAVFNDTTNPRVLPLQLPVSPIAAQRWCTTTGEREDWALVGLTSDRAVKLSLEPMELCCLRLRAPAAGEELSTTSRTFESASSHLTYADTVELPDGWRLELPYPSGSIVPISVSAGWETQGFAKYSGVARYFRPVEVSSSSRPLVLTLPSVHSAVEVRWNGHRVGRRAWSPYRFVVPGELVRAGSNDLELLVASAAGNKYYSGTPFDPGPDPSGLASAPKLSSVH